MIRSRKKAFIILFFVSLVILLYVLVLIARKEKQSSEQKIPQTTEKQEQTKLPEHPQTANLFPSKPENDNTSLAKEKFRKMSLEDKMDILLNMEEADRDILEMALSDKSEELKLNAIYSMTNFALDGIIFEDLISKALNDESENVRYEALSIIDTIPDEDNKTALKLIHSAFDSKYYDCKIYAIKSIISIEPDKKEVANLIVSALSDDHAELKEWALAAADYLWEQDFTSVKEAIDFIRKNSR